MKTMRFGVAIALALFGFGAAGAAERVYTPGGMWTPKQIAAVHGETLKKMGLQLDPAAFADPLRFPLSAIVSLGGGSASFVSPEGLVVTNHHCVRSILQFNSHQGRNLLREGYLAAARADELPGGPTARIYVTTAVRDVTARVLGGLAELRDDLARDRAAEKRKKEIIKEAEAAAPGTRCEVAAFYGGSQYFLIERLELRDVRLVWAPHEGIGFFGGDVDNWIWPRHCGDFALLRGYIGPDGKPADYSNDNVPYQSKSFFKLAGQGLKPGDLALVIGYPGRTARLATAAEARETVGWEYPRRVELAQKQIDRLHKIADGNEALTIKAAAAIAGLENMKKKRQGILEAARTSGLVELKNEQEKSLKAWIAADPARAAKYGGAIERLDALRAGQSRTRERDLAFDNIVGGSALLSAAVTIARLAEERPKPDLERESGYQQRDWPRLEQAQERAQKSYARELDRGVLELFLGEAAKLPEAQRPEIINLLFEGGPSNPESIKSRAFRLFASTKLEDLNRRIELLRGADTASLNQSTDPLILFALTALPEIKAGEERDKRRAGALLLARPRYFAALSEMNQGRLAPDANGTIRVTFGTVRGFSPAPGRPEYFPFTNVWEMAGKWARAKGATPFDAPARIIAALGERRFGPYAEPALGGVPVNFLTDLDITNGNSGSPTLNARGEFAGIVFDGNIEGVGSDLVFQESLTRSIHADVRYLKWLLDAVDGDRRLLREMGVEPAFK